MSLKIPPAAPLFGQRAVNPTEAMFPELWPGLHIALAPCLAPKTTSPCDLSIAPLVPAGATSISGFVLSPWGSAVKINGSSDQITWSGAGGAGKNKAKLTLGGPFCVSCGFRWNASAGAKSWLYASNATATVSYRGHFAFVDESNGQLCTGYADGSIVNPGYYHTENSFIPSNTWTHVICQFNQIGEFGFANNFLRDGVHCTTVSTTGTLKPLSNSTGGISIGRNGGSSSVIDVAFLFVWGGPQFVEHREETIERMFADPFSPLRTIEDDDSIGAARFDSGMSALPPY